MNIIDNKKETDCQSDADGHKVSSYELYCLAKVKDDHSHLKKRHLNCGSMKEKTR